MLSNTYSAPIAVENPPEAEIPEPQELTPRQIVQELDRYIVGQDRAKRCVAVAMRNRWRRQQVTSNLREEITPKNIIMIGATGIGKTEIARRLAKLAHAPFLKVEASKFTEVGYVGKDVDSMIRDLVELSINLIRQEEMATVEKKAKEVVEEKLLEILYPSRPEKIFEANQMGFEPTLNTEKELDRTREKLKKLLRDGALDDKLVEIKLTEKPHVQQFEVFSPQGFEEVSMNLKEMFGNFMPKNPQPKKVKVAEARTLLYQEEAQKLIDMDLVKKKAVARVEHSGIIFLDEIDKIASKGSTHGPDISREGVQRDLLPIIEGTTVTTKYGIVRTDHILFIAAGAFHVSKPSDLIPELQGRFPIRVELDPLTEKDLVRILQEPENSLPKQYAALLATEGVEVKFTDDAIRRIAQMAAKINHDTENIGARRLHTVMEKLLEEISFGAPEVQGAFDITAEFVDKRLSGLVENKDLARYIL